MTLLEWLETNRSTLEDGVYTYTADRVFFNSEGFRTVDGLEQTSDEYQVENGVIHLMEDVQPLPSLMQWLKMNNVRNGLFETDGNGLLWVNGHLYEPETYVQPTKYRYSATGGIITRVKVNNEIDKLLHLDKSASDYLNEAANLLSERGKQYDKSGQERSMEKIVRIFNDMTGQSLTTVEGWYFMQVLKDVRFFQNTDKPHEDSLLDKVSYAALMTEEALKDVR